MAGKKMKTKVKSAPAPEVAEDVTDVILNLKDVVVTSEA